MQLNSILHLTGELLKGQGESPSADGADSDALLPFAAVLSGAFSLLVPAEQASGEGADAEAAPSPLLAPGLEEINLAEIAALDPEASATLPLAAEASQEGVVLDQNAMPDGEVAQPTRLEPGATAGDDAALQIVAEEASPAKSLPQDVEVDAHGPVRSEATSKSEPVPVMPAEEVAPPTQAAETETEVVSTLAEDEALSEQDEVRRGQRQAPRPSTQRAGERHFAPTQATISDQISTKQQPAEPVAAAPVSEAEMAATPDAAAAEIDAALPDLEGAAREKTPATSSEPEANATTTRTEGDDVSSDAGDDQDAPREDTRRTRASRRSHRADAEPSVVQKSERFSAQASPLQEVKSPEAAPAIETTPEQTDPNLASPDLDPGLALAEEHVSQTATERSTSEASAGRARVARGGLPQSRAVPAAWLRAVLSNARQSVFADGGWKVLEMNLDDGDGTVTIKAKREEGRVAVAVGFSDPELRALASTHADRLQEALQTEYETAVDFSLFSNDAGHSADRHQAEGAGASISGAASTDSEGDVRDDRPSRRPLPTGAQHEWVG